jgi:uncharacterized membrane protein YbaN (DUF454 family)
MVFRRSFFLVSGVLMVALGTAGIFLPLLPTTPFLLLAAYLFARSSDRLHVWLLGHRYLGPYIHAFRNKSGLTRSQKLRLAASFTVLMGISLYFAPVVGVKYLLGGMWLFWMVWLIRSRTAPTARVMGRREH